MIFIRWKVGTKLDQFRFLLIVLNFLKHQFCIMLSWAYWRKPLSSIIDNIRFKFPFYYRLQIVPPFTFWSIYSNNDRFFPGILDIRCMSQSNKSDIRSPDNIYHSFCAAFSCLGLTTQCLPGRIVTIIKHSDNSLKSAMFCDHVLYNEVCSSYLCTWCLWIQHKPDIF